MEFKILWTPESKLEYNNVLEQILEKWSKKEVENFIQKSNKVLSLIVKTPQMYPKAKGRTVCKCVITKQVSLYYRMKNKELELLSFWDNRQDPKKLKY